MSGDVPAEMESEFDRFAGWTAEAIDRSSVDAAMAAAASGGGGPAVLTWFADRLDVGPTTRFLDAGGGLGGPAAWLRRRHSPDLVVVEPMEQAAGGVRSLWDLTVIRAWAEDLPFASHGFDAGWALGVLDTTTAKAELLRELYRVTRPGGLFGLLSYECADDAGTIGDVPAGNDFPTGPHARRLVGAAGWAVAEVIEARSLEGSPRWWDDAADAVEARVMADHDGDEEVEHVRSQQRQLARLFESDQVVTRLYLLSRPPDRSGQVQAG